MNAPSSEHLSRRERQIMEILWRSGRASAWEVREALPSPPSYSAVRAMLRLLEEKGHLRHERERRKYVFLPVVSPRRARRNALRSLMHIFFENSVEQTVASLLDLRSGELGEEDYERLQQLIEKAKKERGSGS